MERSIEYIDKHRDEFVWCPECGTFNSANNEECWCCGSTNLNTEIGTDVEDELDFCAYALGIEPSEQVYTIK